MLRVGGAGRTRATAVFDDSCVAHENPRTGEDGVLSRVLALRPSLLYRHQDRPLGVVAYEHVLVEGYDRIPLVFKGHNLSSRHICGRERHRADGLGWPRAG